MLNFPKKTLAFLNDLFLKENHSFHFFIGGFVGVLLVFYWGFCWGFGTCNSKVISVLMPAEPIG